MHLFKLKLNEYLLEFFKLVIQLCMNELFRPLNTIGNHNILSFLLYVIQRSQYYYLFDTSDIQTWSTIGIC